MTDDGQMMWRIDPGRGWPLDEDDLVEGDVIDLGASCPHSTGQGAATEEDS